MDRDLLTYENIGKSYPGRGGDHWAVRAIDLTIGRGEAVGLLGPNRAGKTTLAKLALGLCLPDEGRITRFGRPSTDRSNLGRVGFVPEGPAFPRDVVAIDFLRYLGALSLVPRSVLRERVPRLLEDVGLADRAREPIGRFSKGMLRRLALAQALLAGPDLLILDEPAEGLDLPGRDLLRDIVRRRRDQGGGALLISHVAAEVEALCDRAVVLVEGRKVFDGPLADLTGHHDPKHQRQRPGPAAPRLERSLAALYRGPAA